MIATTNDCVWGFLLRLIAWTWKKDLFTSHIPGFQRRVNVTQHGSKCHDSGWTRNNPIVRNHKDVTGYKSISALMIISIHSCSSRMSHTGCALKSRWVHVPDLAQELSVKTGVSVADQRVGTLHEVSLCGWCPRIKSMLIRQHSMAKTNLMHIGSKYFG